VKRSDLSHTVQETLKRLPPPYDAHYGIVPPPPPEKAVAIDQATKSLDEARGALGKIDAIAGQMKDPYIVSRVLTRREAVSSSSIEGRQSTLDSGWEAATKRDEQPRCNLSRHCQPEGQHDRRKFANPALAGTWRHFKIDDAIATMR